MSQGFLIIRTDQAKETFVAKQIALLGYDAWVPLEIVRCRGQARRRTSAKALIQCKELPVLPKTLFCAIPVSLQADLLRIRHLVAIERGADSAVLQIPYSQIAIFRDEIDKLNREVLALAAIQTKKQKAKWRDMKAALQELVNGTKTEIEIAA